MLQSSYITPFFVTKGLGSMQQGNWYQCGYLLGSVRQGNWYQVVCVKGRDSLPYFLQAKKKPYHNR